MIGNRRLHIGYSAILRFAAALVARCPPEHAAAEQRDAVVPVSLVDLADSLAEQATAGWTDCTSYLFKW